MSERWRDKKSEPGFVFHPWMGTVDELEDIIAAKDAEIARLRDLLHRARGWLPATANRRPTLKLALADIDAALNGNGDQARSS